MNHCVISSKTLFHPGNNPAKRMDAGFAMMLQQMEAGVTDTDPRKTIRAVFRNEAAWLAWVRGLHIKTTLQEVEAHITTAFTGLPKNRQASLSEEVKAGIHEMAKTLCAQEARVLEETLLEKLAVIHQLRELGKTPPA